MVIRFAVRRIHSSQIYVRIHVVPFILIRGSAYPGGELSVAVHPSDTDEAGQMALELQAQQFAKLTIDEMVST